MQDERVVLLGAGRGALGHGVIIGNASVVVNDLRFDRLVVVFLGLGLDLSDDWQLDLTSRSRLELDTTVSC